MKNFLLIAFTLMVVSATAQNSTPCKVVHIGMNQAEVMKLCGNPTERDTLGLDKNSSHDYLIIWHYGNPGMEDNQRVSFTNDRVTEVVSNGKKYDEMLAKVKSGGMKGADLEKELNKLNAENCK
jgi:hypothetical protein